MKRSPFRKEQQNMVGEENLPLCYPVWPALGRLLTPLLTDSYANSTTDCCHRRMSRNLSPASFHSTLPLPPGLQSCWPLAATDRSGRWSILAARACPFFLYSSHPFLSLSFSLSLFPDPNLPFLWPSFLPVTSFSLSLNHWSTKMCLQCLMPLFLLPNEQRLAHPPQIATVAPRKPGQATQRRSVDSDELFEFMHCMLPSTHPAHTPPPLYICTHFTRFLQVPICLTPSCTPCVCLLLVWLLSHSYVVIISSFVFHS